METYTTIVKFFQEGGFFMYPIALVMAVGAAVAIERYVYLSRADPVPTARCGNELMPVLQGGKFPQALSMTGKSDVGDRQDPELRAGAHQVRAPARGHRDGDGGRA